MDDRILDKVFIGCLQGLPTLSSKIVRIFTSSTFTDMSLERNTLMESVYPKIKEYCKQRYGLEFQVVDMRWGVRDEATDDHMTTELCMREIENCQRLSMGPNFVAFLGQKYGYRPIPTFIDAQEFLTFRGALEDMNITEAELLDLWYKEDKNAVPPVYILQPISSILVHFTNRSEPELQSKDQSIWWQTLSKLQKLLRMAGNHLFVNQSISADVKHNYMMSVTEREIINGVLNVNSVKKHCLAYFRQINKIDGTDTKVVEKFIDLTEKGSIDIEAQDLLKDLRDNRLTQKITEPNLARFSVDWSTDGLNSSDNYQYLQQFCEHFYNNITKLIRRAMRREDRSLFGNLFNEILHHSHSCNANVEVFEGRDRQLTAIEKYIKSDSNIPLVLHGMSGCGKTSLIAKAATLLDVWLQNDSKYIVIQRYIGTTPDSSSIIPFLTSICQQISYNFMLSMDELPDDLIGLTFHFKQLLLRTKEQLVFIFIDSIDQLSENIDSAMKLSFLTQQFPNNVKVIVSCDSHDSKDFMALNRLIENKDQFIEVEALGPDLAINVIKRWLQLKGRDITRDQWLTVEDVIKQCSLPIFAKLVFSEIIRWKSYSKANQTLLSNTVMDCIFRLFDRIEVQHGRTLVSHALSYITASKSLRAQTVIEYNECTIVTEYDYHREKGLFMASVEILDGLSESELEDCLSLDDIVLDDVFQYHLPPVRRIPPLLWTRIRNDLPNYLTERSANGVNAMNWYHKQFREASIQRYFAIESNVKYFHSSIADYYLGVWGGGIDKPFKYTESQKQRFKLVDDEGKADRKVPTQPLAYFTVDERLSGYNLRKLSELPFHLIRAQRFDDLLDKVLFNYDWLHSKLSCFLLQSVLSDFEDSIVFMSKKFNQILLKEISLVADTLRLSASVIMQFPDMIAPQILARLLPLKNHCPNISNLLKQCDSKGAHHCALLPVNHCLHTPGGPLMYSLEGHPFAVFDFVFTSDYRYVISVSNRYIMWDLSTGEITLDIDPLVRGIMPSLVITSDDKYAITSTNYNEIIILNIISAEITIIDSKQTQFDCNILGMALSLNGLHCIVWTDKEWIIFDPKLFSSDIHKNTINYFDNKESDKSLNEKITLVLIEFIHKNEIHFIYKLTENQFSVKTVLNNKTFKALEFKSGFALNTSRTVLFVGDHLNQVLYHRRRRNKWSPNRLLSSVVPQSGDQLLSLRVCKNKFLVAFHLRGFSIWTIDSLPLNRQQIYLHLPSDVRNISTKPLRCPNPLVFTKCHQYAIAGIRNNFYIWSMQSTDLLKSMDAHFARILQMKSLIVDDLDVIVSSSLDKTIKVWNIVNLFERIHCIDKMDLTIDSIHFSQFKDLVLTVTRNSVGIWCLNSGQLLTSLSESKIGAIVTQAVITDDTKYVVSIESQTLLIWDLDNQTILYKEPQSAVKKLMLADRDSKVITVRKISDDHDISEMLLTTISIPSGQTLFTIEFKTSKRCENLALITKDNKYIVISMFESLGTEMLAIYRLQNGFLIHYIKLEKIDFNELIALRFRGKDTVVGLIGHQFSYILDIYTQKVMTKIKRWNGQISSDGKYGLFSPRGGGLELIDLKFGTTVKVLLPQTSEGVVNVITDFTSDNNYVYYYHSIKKTLRLIRLEDGKALANYRLSADAKVIKSSPDSKYLVIGGIDGSLIVLIIADPKSNDCMKCLSELPTRLPESDGKSKNLFKTAAKLAVIASKARKQSSDSESKFCVLS